MALLGVKTMLAEVDTRKGEAGPGLAAQPALPALRKKRQNHGLKTARTRQVPCKPGLHNEAVSLNGYGVRGWEEMVGRHLVFQSALPGHLSKYL